MFKLFKFIPVCFIFLCISSFGVQASTPRLLFSDLISGPDTGIGDALGSGDVVTLWGQFLGEGKISPAVNITPNYKVFFTDSKGVRREASYIYYWKNADGKLPSGPANLYASHKMQEVAFSIPDSANGKGEITVTVNGRESNPLPFTVRAGNIYHVMAKGNDSTGDGSFNKPWSTVGYAITTITSPGSTVYIHDSIVSGSKTTYHAIYWNQPSATSTITNQYGIVAYPGSQPSAIGENGFRDYKTQGEVISKFKVFASNCDEVANGQTANCGSNQSMGIQGSAYGRIVANTVTDRAGGCASASQGAITANALGADRVSDLQILGNEIHDYGCNGSRKFQHTTYLTVRSGSANLQVPAWRFGWNYLHDNLAKNGIHNYDENQTGTLCGSPTGTVVINDNVVVNQAGAGIFVGVNCPWTSDFDVYNNVLINVGLAAAWDGRDVNTSNGANTGGISIKDNGLMGTATIHNNIIDTWNNDDQSADAQACLGLQGGGSHITIKWNNNICYTHKDKLFVGAGSGSSVSSFNVSGSNNNWYFSGGSSTKAIKPQWDTSPIVGDPLIKISGSQISIGAGSPIIGKDKSALLSYGIYGLRRMSTSEVGAVEYANRPNWPVDIGATKSK